MKHTKSICALSLLVLFQLPYSLSASYETENTLHHSTARTSESINKPVTDAVKSQSSHVQSIVPDLKISTADKTPPSMLQWVSNLFKSTESKTSNTLNFTQDSSNTEDTANTTAHNIEKNIDHKSTSKQNENLTITVDQNKKNPKIEMLKDGIESTTYYPENQDDIKMENFSLTEQKALGLLDINSASTSPVTSVQIVTDAHKHKEKEIITRQDGSFITKKYNVNDEKLSSIEYFDNKSIRIKDIQFLNDKNVSVTYYAGNKDNIKMTDFTEKEQKNLDRFKISKKALSYPVTSVQIVTDVKNSVLKEKEIITKQDGSVIIKNYKRSSDYLYKIDELNKDKILIKTIELPETSYNPVTITYYPENIDGIEMKDNSTENQLVPTMHEINPELTISPVISITITTNREQNEKRTIRRENGSYTINDYNRNGDLIHIQNYELVKNPSYEDPGYLRNSKDKFIIQLINEQFKDTETGTSTNIDYDDTMKVTETKYEKNVTETKYDKNNNISFQAIGHRPFPHKLDRTLYAIPYPNIEADRTGSMANLTTNELYMKSGHLIPDGIIYNYPNHIIPSSVIYFNTNETKGREISYDATLGKLHSETVTDYNDSGKKLKRITSYYNSDTKLKDVIRYTNEKQSSSEKYDKNGSSIFTGYDSKEQEISKQTISALVNTTEKKIADKLALDTTNNKTETDVANILRTDKEISIGSLTSLLLQAPKEMLPGHNINRSVVWSALIGRITDNLGLTTTNKAVAAQVETISNEALNTADTILIDTTSSEATKTSRIQGLINSMTASLQKLVGTSSKNGQAANN